MATIIPGNEQIIRFVRYVPDHLAAPGPAAEAWIRANVPKCIDPREAWLPCAFDHDQLNECYRGTLYELGKCGLQRGELQKLLGQLVREGEAAIAWHSGKREDRYSKEREAEKRFLGDMERAVRAAKLLARVFENQSATAVWTATAAVIKGMEEVELEGLPADATGQMPKVPGPPFVHWKTPPSSGRGDVTYADYLRALMGRLAHELESARAGGEHQMIRGPFLYPGPKRPTARAQLLENGLLYIAVRGARIASGAADFRSVGALMPEGETSYYGLAAAYLHDVTRAVFPPDKVCDFTPAEAYERLKMFMRRNQGVVCLGWAHLRNKLA